MILHEFLFFVVYYRRCLLSALFTIGVVYYRHCLLSALLTIGVVYYRRCLLSALFHFPPPSVYVVSWTSNLGCLISRPTFPLTLWSLR